jgi:hypothetical protein
MQVQKFWTKVGWMERMPYAEDRHALWKLGHRSVELGSKIGRIGVEVAMDVCFHAHVNTDSIRED